MYCCYLLSNGQGRTYIGSTNNFERRLRQHNGELAGGAKYTTAFKGDNGWNPVLLVEGFIEKKVALSFEWRMKKHRNTQNKLKPAIGLNIRIKNVFQIIAEDQITKPSCLVSSLPEITIKIKEPFYLNSVFKELIAETLENKANIKIEILN